MAFLPVPHKRREQPYSGPHSGDDACKLTVGPIGSTNYPPEFFHTHYTNATFGDDGGRTWKASEPVPIMGTGEAPITELAGGTIHYNTRRYRAPHGPARENP